MIDMDGGKCAWPLDWLVLVGPLTVRRALKGDAHPREQRTHRSHTGLMHRVLKPRQRDYIARY